MKGFCNLEVEKIEDLTWTADCHVWQRRDLAKLFLEEHAGGIPLAAEDERMDVLLPNRVTPPPKLTKLWISDASDSGLGRTVWLRYPRRRVRRFSRSKAATERRSISQANLRRPRPRKEGCRTRSVSNHAPFDACALSFWRSTICRMSKSIKVYQEIFDL